MAASSSEPSPLTVLFAPAHTLIDESQGGSEYHWAYKLIERLALDHGVQIIALTVQSHVTRQLPGVQFISVQPGGTLPTTSLESLRFHLRVYATAREILSSDQRVDVVHHMLPFGFRSTFNVLALLHRRTDPPIVIGPLQPPLSFIGNDEGRIAVRDFSLGEDMPRSNTRRNITLPPARLLMSPVLFGLSRATLRRADTLVAISDRTKRLYRSFSGLDRLSVIPPGVDTSIFVPRPWNERACDEEGMRTVEILSVGYLLQRKAFDVVIRALGKLAENRLPVHLRIVGDGPARASLETLTRQLGIAHMVTFVGRVSHNMLVSEYQKADVFCSTSRSEGFATVSLEALACGLPIIATPSGGFRELLSQREIGTLVPFGDVDRLASALAELVTSRPRREMLGRHARNLAVQEYDWSVIARRYLSLYQKAARRENC